MLDMIVAVQNWIADRKAQIEERGATATEYALLVALIAIAIFATVKTFGQTLMKIFDKAGSDLGGAAGVS